MVRPLSRAAARTCARPGCPSPASATLRFRYETREIHLDDLADQQEPESYDLCAGHTERTGAPYGWSLEDRRSEPDGSGVGPIGGEGTVALLAQMLGRDRGVSVADDVAPSGRPRLFDDDDPQAEVRADAW